jgi:hypothetical protein
MDEER